MPAPPSIDSPQSSAMASPASQQRLLVIPRKIEAALDQYVTLSAAIAAVHAVQDQIPIQKRTISNLRGMLELEKRELTRRETLRKRDEAQVASLGTVSISSVVAMWSGNLDARFEELRRSIQDHRKAEDKVREQSRITSEKLMAAIADIAEMEERNEQLEEHRKNIRELLDKAFEDDKEDESLRIKISSTKANYRSATDEFDRHIAAEEELKLAVKFMGSALMLLRLLKDHESAQEEWVVARFLYEAKEFNLRSDICTQNAFAYDPTLPEHQDIPQSPDTSRDRIAAAIARTSAKLDQVHQSLNFIFTANESLTPRITRLALELRELRETHARRRIEVIETYLEILGRGRNPRVVDDGIVLLPVDMSDLAGRRPVPNPVRIVDRVPTVTEGLPVYEP